MSDSMSIEEYLAHGGILTSPANVPPRYRGELLRIMAVFVDSELAGAAGFADKINTAPGIRERIAASRIVLEKTEHAQRVLAIMASFGVDAERYSIHYPWGVRTPQPATASNETRPEDRRLSVFHYPLQGWTDAVVMNVMMGTAAEIQLAELSRVSYAPLADAFRFIAPREAAHTRLGTEGLMRICETQAGRNEAARSVALWRPLVAATFGAAGSARFEILRAFGLRHARNEAMLADWEVAVAATLAKMRLA